MGNIASVIGAIGTGLSGLSSLKSAFEDPTDQAKEMADYNWKRYQSPAAQVRAMRQAGINPASMLEGTSIQANTEGANPSPYIESKNQQSALALQSAMQMAQIDNLNAQTKNIEADTQKKGYETETIKTENEFIEKRRNGELNLMSAQMQSEYAKAQLTRAEAKTQKEIYNRTVQEVENLKTNQQLISETITKTKSDTWLTNLNATWYAFAQKTARMSAEASSTSANAALGMMKIAKEKLPKELEIMEQQATNLAKQGDYQGMINTVQGFFMKSKLMESEAEEAAQHARERINRAREDNAILLAAEWFCNTIGSTALSLAGRGGNSTNGTSSKSVPYGGTSTWDVQPMYTP